MLIAIGLSSALAAVVSGVLYLGEEEHIGGSHEMKKPAATVQQTSAQDPFLQEYQELEKLLEETRAERKRQQVKLAQQIGIQPEEDSAQEKVAQIKEEVPKDLQKEPVVEQQKTPQQVKVAQHSSKPAEITLSPKREQVESAQQTGIQQKGLIVQQPEAQPVADSKKPVVEQPLPGKTIVEPPRKQTPSPVVKRKTEKHVSKKGMAEKAEVGKAAPKPQPVSKAQSKSQPQMQASPKSKTKPKPKSRSKRRNHIQMVTFTSRKRAEAVVKDLRDANFNAEMVPVRSRGKRYYLVRDYSPKNRKEALALKKVYDEWLKVDSLVRY